MSSRELIESLRRAGEENIRVVKREAEQETAALQAAAVQKIVDLQKEYGAERLAAVSGDELRRARAEASNSARALRLDVEKAFADGLYSIARFSLSRLRDDRYPMVFERLVQELPALPWMIVRVHSLDVELARKYFPTAEILAVGSISGGIDVITADGSIRVINTFEKRLERIWIDLLPQIINDAYREVGDGSSSKS